MPQGLRRRRFRQGLMIFYSLFLTIASALFIAVVMLKSDTVILDDWAVVMQRRVADIPASIEILDSRWGSAELTHSEAMFQLDSLIKRVPRYHGSLHKGPDSDYRMLGKVTYISGKNVTFALGEVLWLDETPYYSPGSADELAGILRLMRRQVYTVQNLAGMMRQAQRMTVHAHSGAAAALPRQEREVFVQSLLSASLLEAVADVQVALQDAQQPAYRIHLQLSEQPGDSVVLLVYANEYIQVYDMVSARGALLHLSGDLFRYCSDVLDARP